MDRLRSLEAIRGLSPQQPSLRRSSFDLGREDRRHEQSHRRAGAVPMRSVFANLTVSQIEIKSNFCFID